MIEPKDYISKERGPNRDSSALDSLRRLCASKEMCSADIRKKLERMGVEEDKQLDILKCLLDEKFFDDSRYSQAFVKDKSRLAGWGTIKIRHALRSKGISEETIISALEGIDRDEEGERLHKILHQKFKSYKKGDDKEKNLGRLIRFALSRGFDYEMSIRVSKEIIG